MKVFFNIYNLYPKLRKNLILNIAKIMIIQYHSPHNKSHLSPHIERLEALSVDDGWTRFVILGLGDPHLLEGGKGSKDGSSDPDRVLSLRRSDDLDLHGGRGKGGDLLLHSLGNSWVHGSSSGKDDVGVQILSDINITLHDGLESTVVDTTGLLSDEGRLEEDFWASESLVTDSDDVTIWKLVTLLELGGFSSGLHLLVEVKGDVGQLLLNISDDFSLGSGGEGVTSLGQDLHQVIGKITSSQVKSDNGVWKSISLIDRNGVGNTISTIKNTSGGSSGSVKGKDGLDRDVHGWDVEGLEHDLGHSLSVGLWVEWSLSQKDRVLLWGNSELIVKGVMPDLLHIVPVGNDTVLDWVLKGKNSSLDLGFISNVGILLVHADHDSRVLRSSDDGRKDGSWGIVSGETGLWLD